MAAKFLMVNARSFSQGEGTYYQQTLIKLHEYAIRLGRREQHLSECEDWANEALCRTRDKALQQLRTGQYIEQGKFYTWLTTLLYHEWRTVKQESRRHYARLESTELPQHRQRLLQQVAPSYDAASLLTRQQWTQVQQQLADLSAERRCLLEDYYLSYSQPKITELARDYKRSVSWVKTNLSRLREQIRAGASCK